jgi:cell division transport system permease protein
MAASTKPKYLYPILGIALVLYVLGIFLLITLHTQSLVASLKEKVDVWLEMHINATPQEAAELIARVTADARVVPGSVHWMSKEEAAAQIKTELGDENMLEDLPSMMRDVVQFHVLSQSMNTADMTALQEEMKADSLVSEVFFESAQADQITQNLSKLGKVALALALLLIVISMILLHNTVRLALYSNRLLVKNMQLVGATNGFIKAPYLWRAALNGLWASLIAILLLIGSMYFLSQYTKGLGDMEADWTVFATFALLVAIGLMMSLFSTWFTLNKYLNTRVEDLY